MCINKLKTFESYFIFVCLDELRELWTYGMSNMLKKNIVGLSRWHKANVVNLPTFEKENARNVKYVYRNENDGNKNMDIRSFSLGFPISFGKMKCSSNVNLIKSMEMWRRRCLPKVKVKNRFKMHHFICTRASKAFNSLFSNIIHANVVYAHTRPAKNQSSTSRKNGFRTACWLAYFTSARFFLYRRI